MSDECVVAAGVNSGLPSNKTRHFKSPVVQGKVESLGKLNDIFKELDEVFSRAKQAFQVFKTKSFFYPEPDFTRPFAESMKQVEGRLQVMGSLLGTFMSRQSAALPTGKRHSGEGVAMFVDTPENLVKTNGAISITPPASDIGNDEGYNTISSDTITNTSKLSGVKVEGRSTRKRGSNSLPDDSSTVQPHKKSRRSLIEDYMTKDEDDSKSKVKEESTKEEEEEFEVERIVDIAKAQGHVSYYVKWKGYAHQDNTWEPPANLTGCEDILFEFYKERLKKLEKNSTEDLNYHLLPIDPSNREVLHKAFHVHITPSEEERQRGICALVSSKPPVLKSQREVDDLVDKALNCRKKERYRTIVKVIVDNQVMKELKGERKRQEADLRRWERHINSICSDSARLSVENFADLDLPPTDFLYINQSRAGEGVTIPSDPVVGCECEDCGSSKVCCPNQMNTIVAFNKHGRLKQQVSFGTPIYECNSLCSCGPDCVNRVVQKGRTIGLCIFRTDNRRGWGVKATENIKRDSLVTEYVGEVITSEEAERRGQIYDAQGCTYLFDLDYNNGDQNPYTIDAAKCGNVSHFINHSCDPNLVVFNVWVNCLDPDLPRLALFATRDIKRGEELTFDYNSGLKSGDIANGSVVTDIILTPEKSEKQQSQGSSEMILKTPKGNRGLQYGKTECHCGAANCRKYFF